jgi:hypothetical protein
MSCCMISGLTNKQITRLMISELTNKQMARRISELINKQNGPLYDK